MHALEPLYQHRVTRRRLISSVGAGLVAAPALMLTREASASENLVLVTWGGSFAEVIKRVIAEPFTRETGIGVTLVSGPDTAKAKAQVATGKLEWDIFDGSGGEMHNAAREGLFEELDFSIISTSGLVGRASVHAMPFLIYAGGIAYDPKRTPKPPRTFREFFDLQNFKGKRGLRARVSETLEMVLLADGVEPERLYPLDVERAFALLTRIKPSIAKWIDQTPQTITLLTGNELSYVYTYNGRVATAKKEGLSVEFSTDQNLLLTQYYSVMKGTRKRTQAMRYISFACRPDIQANLSNAYYSVPVRVSAISKVSKEVSLALPFPFNPKNVFMQEAFWSENHTKLDRRFKEWLAS